MTHSSKSPAVGAGSPAPTAGCPSLLLTEIGKTFGSHRALRDVSLEVRAGGVHALLGQNGSGKSTLIKVLSGFHAADPGAHVVLNGQVVDLYEPAHRSSWRRHLRFVHQDLALVDALDATENLALERGFATTRLGRVDWAAERRRATELFDRLGFDIDLGVPVARLSPAERTLIAIARALQDWDADQFGVLVLDEPTTTLSRLEADRLYEVVRRIAARGAGVVLVTHNLPEVMSVADRFSILRDGVLVHSGATKDVDESALVELIIGRPVERMYSESEGSVGDTALRVTGLASTNVGPLDLEVRSGEIIGIAGLEGSGREQVAGLISGADKPLSGDIEINGSRVQPGDIRASLRAGLALLPAERVVRGIVGELSVCENVMLSGYSTMRRGPERLYAIQRGQEHQTIVSWMDRLDVRPSEPGRATRTLSGGNQQKVVLARVLRRGPRVLVLDEPTQGVDVGARAKIYEEIAAAATAGMAVIICSSDDAELAHECDRVLVMREGQLTCELSGARLTEESIAAEALSSAAATPRTQN